MKPAFALALLLAGCNVAPDPAELSVLKQATETVRHQLPQPDSAHFKRVIAYGNAVCGEVNASVGMGRTGYERFILKDGKVTLSSQLPTDEAMNARWAADCKH